jgi:hypothetical protein
MNTKWIDGGQTYAIRSDDNTINVRTSIGGETNIYLPKLRGDSEYKKIFINDIDGNASTNPINLIVSPNTNNSINGGQVLTLTEDLVSIEVLTASSSEYLVLLGNNNPSPSTHNDLDGLQGGTNNEYYHLTSEQTNALTTGGNSNNVLYRGNNGLPSEAENVAIENDNLRLKDTTNPTTPSVDGINILSKKIAGRSLPSFIDSSGVEYALMPSIGSVRYAYASAIGSSTVLSTFGLTLTQVGTAGSSTPSFDSIYNSIRKANYSITIPSTSAVVSVRTSGSNYGRGAVPNAGGFYQVFTFGCASGMSNLSKRLFCGMRAGSATSDVSPTTLTDIIGVGFDSGDSNFSFIHNDSSGTATKVDLGVNFPVPTVDAVNAYSVLLFSYPNGDDIYYEFKDIVNGNTISGSVNTDIPSQSTALLSYLYASVGGVSSVIGVSFMSLVIETNN